MDQKAATIERERQRASDYLLDALSAVDKANAVLRVAHEHYDMDGDVDEHLWEVITDNLNHAGQSLTLANADLTPDQIPF